ncbi:MAG: hypothetical protein HQK52_21630 [Oligoflexia bacterium]|nr:hypothetical protein [Oligoflexia bacterium]
MKIKVFLFVVTFALAFGCSHQKTLNPSTNKLEKDNLIRLMATWVKDKGERFDMEIQLTNISTNSLLIPMGMFRCGKGDLQGAITRNTMNSSVAYNLILEQGESRIFNFTCTLDRKFDGPFVFKIVKIFENVNDQKGKELASELTLSTTR